jgi:K+-transporting ATPase ATPase A chain
MANGGPHGLSEVSYAFTSAVNTNGSAVVTVILCARTFRPALALGPLAEGVH